MGLEEEKGLEVDGETDGIGEADGVYVGKYDGCDDDGLTGEMEDALDDGKVVGLRVLARCTPVG